MRVGVTVTERRDRLCNVELKRNLIKARSINLARFTFLDPGSLFQMLPCNWLNYGVLTKDTDIFKSSTRLKIWFNSCIIGQHIHCKTAKKHIIFQVICVKDAIVLLTICLYYRVIHRQATLMIFGFIL